MKDSVIVPEVELSGAGEFYFPGENSFLVQYSCHSTRECSLERRIFQESCYVGFAHPLSEFETDRFVSYLVLLRDGSFVSEHLFDHLVESGRFIKFLEYLLGLRDLKR